MKKWFLRALTVKWLNWKCLSHYSATVQGLKRSIPLRLSLSQSGVDGFELCSMMLRANLGAMMPA